jgi:hypothetical protein
LLGEVEVAEAVSMMAAVVEVDLPSPIMSAETAEVLQLISGEQVVMAKEMADVVATTMVRLQLKLDSSLAAAAEVDQMIIVLHNQEQTGR